MCIDLLKKALKLSTEYIYSICNENHEKKRGKVEIPTFDVDIKVKKVRILDISMARQVKNAVIS